MTKPSCVLIYKGVRVLSAIRSLRRITGHSLGDCHNILRNPNGFILTEEASDTLLKDYLTNDPDAVLANHRDWFVTDYDSSQPVDMRAHEFSTPL